jgi:coproporphyrinogen III oxidase
VLDRRRTQEDADTLAFHAADEGRPAPGLKGVADYDKYKKWCDEYFYSAASQGSARHRRHLLRLARRGDWDADLAFTQDVGRAFLKIYPELVGAISHALDAEDREEQLIRRGRYVEFNLLYDRGTILG